MIDAFWIIISILFFSGLAMTVLRRQLLAMLLGLELMISAVNVALVHHAGLIGDVEGLAVAALIIAVAAAEAVIGLSLILKLHRAGTQAETTRLTELRG